MLDILFFIRSLQKSGVHFTRIEVATCKAPNSLMCPVATMLDTTVLGLSQMGLQWVLGIFQIIGPYFMESHKSHLICTELNKLYFC